MELLQEVCPIELCEFLMLWLSYPSCAIPVIVLIFVWSEHMVCVFLIAFPLFWGWFAIHYTDFWEEAG